MASGRPRLPNQSLPVYSRASAGQNGRHPNWGHPDHDACGTGFVARLGGSANYDIIQYALTALERLTHRGGVDADGASGDGAGLLTSLPQDFSGPGQKSRASSFHGISGLDSHSWQPMR